MGSRSITHRTNGYSTVRQLPRKRTGTSSSDQSHQHYFTTRWPISTFRNSYDKIQYMKGLIRIILFSSLTLLSLGILEAQTTTSKHSPIISLDFQEVDVRKALHTLAQFTQQNIVIVSSIQGKISLHISEMPAEEALQAILQLQNLVQKKTGQVHIIHPNRSSLENLAPTQPTLHTKQIIIQHRDVKDIATRLETNYRHTEFTVDPNSNSLWIRDTPDRIQELENLIKASDQAIQQVLIEARIVSVNRSAENTLGIRFGLKPFINSQANISQDNAPLGLPHNNTTRTNNSLLPNLNVDLPLNRHALNLNLPIIWKGLNQLLDLELSAMENAGIAHVISSPHLTLDKTTALIEAGSEIPYQGRNRHGTASVAFKKAVLSLKVTPDLKNTPTIDTQKLKTQVFIHSGETIMLGGIYETVRHKSLYQIPWLSHIPILGWLFKQQIKNNIHRELLIFVTPHLVSETVLKRLKANTPP